MPELLPLRRKCISDRLLCLLLAVLCFSIPFLLYADQLGAGDTIVGGDGLISFYDLIYLKELLHDGTFPLWDPYLAGGTPRGIIVGAPGLYPFNWLIVLFPIAVQMYVYLGVHLAMGGSFMYGYLRRISCSKLVSFLASIMYVFTVHMGGGAQRTYHTDCDRALCAGGFVFCGAIFAKTRT